MKKVFALVLAAMLVLAGIQVVAEDTAVTVYVTIANGSLVLAQEPITVTDIDADGLITINDALYCAHEIAFEGGAEAGFNSEMSTWGLSLTKLWGIENGGSYGYYLNNVSAMGLADAVSNGDFINAYVYQDLATWSDAYCYFDSSVVSAKAGEEIKLTLTSAGWDENWSPVEVPVAGAAIIVNGEMTDIVTAEDGTFTIKVASNDVIISAVSEAMTLVPPVCIITVAE